MREQLWAGKMDKVGGTTSIRAFSNLVEGLICFWVGKLTGVDHFLLLSKSLQIETWTLWPMPAAGQSLFPGQFERILREAKICHVVRLADSVRMPAVKIQTI